MEEKTKPRVVTRNVGCAYDPAFAEILVDALCALALDAGIARAKLNPIPSRHGWPKRLAARQAVFEVVQCIRRAEVSRSWTLPKYLF